MRETQASTFFGFDAGLLLALFGLLAVGLIAVASSSIAVADHATGNDFHYLKRQAAYIVFALCVGGVLLSVPLSLWERLGPMLVLVSFALLLSVWLPGIGKTVNGSTRWLDLGVAQLQVSEVARFLLVVYLASYLVRRADAIRTGLKGIALPMGVLGVVSVLLLAQPDFGSLVMLVSTWLAMLFLGGARWRWVFLLIALGALGVALLVWFEPYRWERLLASLDPWAEPYGRGYQTVNALIAVGSGGMFGQGLGNSMQKLFFLPEVHTDFIFAVWVEELGLIGMTAIVSLYGLFVWRAFALAQDAVQKGYKFAGYLAFGFGVWVGLQAAIHIAVNLGGPPKGITLPFISYGGSSMVVMMVCAALVLRVGYENQMDPKRRALWAQKEKPKTLPKARTKAGAAARAKARVPA